jgi:hypothetical protein
MSGKRKSPKENGNQSGTALLEATGAYLKEIGWVALVASVDRIQGVLGGRAQGQYELVIRFTGGKKLEAARKKLG